MPVIHVGATVWRGGPRIGTARQIRRRRPDAADEEIQTLTTKLTPGLGGYAVLIVVGLFLPTVATVGYLALAVALIAPFGLRKHSTAAT